ncbi:MAG: methyltransferase domain-containing protein [Planctomycetota bacterium]
MEDALKSPPSRATEETIFAYLEASKETTLLDFGCGYGRYLVMFSKHIKTGNLFGAEIDKQRVAVAREMGFNCYEPDPNIPEIPFENNYFDYVFSSDVVEHIPRNHYKKYLLEFHRVLKPGGRLLIGTPNYPFKRIYDFVKAIKTRMFRYYLLDDPGHVNKLSIRRLTRDLKEVFPIVNIRPTYVLFENRFGLIRRNRDRLRLFCDKVFGYCEKR